jgi:uncharacterized protein (DUF58 family)
MALFDEKTLRKLDRLALVAAQVRAGQIKGERRSTKRGTSIEFADYRDYRPGDDLRRVDWNVYARTQRPFVKLHEEEEDLAVHLILDASRSMAWPEDEPERDKFAFARRLAGLLGHLALSAGDRLTAVALSGDRTLSYGPVRGAPRRLELFAWLAALEPAGVTDLDRALRRYALHAARPGLAVVISDLFSPGGYRDGLSALQSRGYELAVVHVLAPAELDPPLAGDLRLVDVETGLPQDVTMDGALRDLYRRRLAAWRAEIGAFVRGRDGHYLSAHSETLAEELVLRDMRRVGLVA